MKNTYIAQAFKYKHDWWMYALPILGFLGLIGLNSIAMSFLEIDVEAFMQSEIEKKGSSRFLIESLIPFAIFLGGLFIWVKYVHKQPWITLTTSRKKTDWGRIWFGFGLIAIFAIITTLIDQMVNPEDYVFQFEVVPFLILAVIVILLIPIQTSFEEYMFRGYMMQGIGVLVKNRWLPLLLTSVVFGLMHIANPEVGKIGPIIMVYYIGTGLFLGIITLMDEGMELALGFHAGNNMITALLVTADWTAFQTDSIFKDVAEPAAGLDIIAPVFIIYPIFIAIMAYKYKWSNWREKLFGKVQPPQEINLTLED